MKDRNWQYAPQQCIVKPNIGNVPYQKISKLQEFRVKTNTKLPVLFNTGIGIYTHTHAHARTSLLHSMDP
jgi:hypothetical protein